LRNGLWDDLFNVLDGDWFRLDPFNVFNGNILNCSDRVRSLRNPFSPFNVVRLWLEPFNVRNLVGWWLDPFLPRVSDWFGLDPFIPFDLVRFGLNPMS